MIIFLPSFHSRTFFTFSSSFSPDVHTLLMLNNNKQRTIKNIPPSSIVFNLLQPQQKITLLHNFSNFTLISIPVGTYSARKSIKLHCENDKVSLSFFLVVVYFWQFSVFTFWLLRSQAVFTFAYFAVFVLWICEFD